jgi:hypothetical protein
VDIIRDYYFGFPDAKTDGSYRGEKAAKGSKRFPKERKPLKER